MLDLLGIATGLGAMGAGLTDFERALGRTESFYAPKMGYEDWIARPDIQERIRGIYGAPEAVPWQAFRNVWERIPGGEGWLESLFGVAEAQQRQQRRAEEIAAGIRTGPLAEALGRGRGLAERMGTLGDRLAATSLGAADVRMREMIEGGDFGISQATIDALIGEITDEINAATRARHARLAEDIGGRGAAPEALASIRETAIGEGERTRAQEIRRIGIEAELERRRRQEQALALAGQIGGAYGGLLAQAAGLQTGAEDLFRGAAEAYHGALTPAEQLALALDVSPPVADLMNLLYSHRMAGQEALSAMDLARINALMSLGGGLLEAGYGLRGQKKMIEAGRPGGLESAAPWGALGASIIGALT